MRPLSMKWLHVRAGLAVEVRVGQVVVGGKTSVGKMRGSWANVAAGRLAMTGGLAVAMIAEKLLVPAALQAGGRGRQKWRGEWIFIGSKWVYVGTWIVSEQSERVRRMDSGSIWVVGGRERVGRLASGGS